MAEKAKCGKFLIVFIFFMTVCISGGFFDYVSCYCSVLLSLFLVIISVRKKKIWISKSLDFLAFLILDIFYLVVSLWAVDSGMAIGGFFKILPAVLFYIFLDQYENFRKYLRNLLPVTGVLMTIFSYVMMQFRCFRPLVSVNNRLSGTFQYPNTFAVFLLVCLILVSAMKERIAILYAVILLFGIYKSGSLTTYILTAVLYVVLAICNKRLRKFLLILGIPIVAGICAIVLTQHGMVDMELKSSTFMGRLLYYKDALPVILKHPFGLGYYGYYFTEKLFQTGVYTVLNVHNELLQFMLDVGWVPALFFFFVLIRGIVKKDSNQPVECRIALALLVIHSMFDYDLQFLSMLFVVILLLPKRETREIGIGRVICFLEVACTCLIAIFGVIYGTSYLFYINGNYKEAVKIGNYNTMAKVQLLSECEDYEEAERLALDIEDNNQYIPLVYHTIAQCEYNRGNIEQYIKNKLHALELDPYNYDGYLEYMNTMLSACSQYIQMKDYDSASICVKRMRSIYDLLDQVSDKTSTLAYKIQDQPTLVLPIKYAELINQLEMRINE